MGSLNHEMMAYVDDDDDEDDDDNAMIWMVFNRTVLAGSLVEVKRPPFPQGAK
jgi:hypothetical protein